MSRSNLRVSGLISLNMGSRGSRSRKLVASPPVSLWAQHHLCGKLAVQTLPLSLDCGNELKAAEVFGMCWLRFPLIIYCQGCVQRNSSKLLAFQDAFCQGKLKFCFSSCQAFRKTPFVILLHTVLHRHRRRWGSGAVHRRVCELCDQGFSHQFCGMRSADWCTCWYNQSLSAARTALDAHG